MGGVYSIRQVGSNKRPFEGVIVAFGSKDEMEQLYDTIWEPGRFAFCWDYEGAPQRKLSQKSLASFRKKRLLTRLKKRHPLFAEELWEREIAANPQFYDGSSNSKG